MPCDCQMAVASAPHDPPLLLLCSPSQVPPEVSEKLAGLESELRKSKRAEQKLQAMLYRMRKDLQDAGGDLATFDRLQEVRTLEYEVDFLTNKVKVSCRGRQCRSVAVA